MKRVDVGWSSNVSYSRRVVRLRGEGGDEGSISERGGRRKEGRRRRREWAEEVCVVRSLGKVLSGWSRKDESEGRCGVGGVLVPVSVRARSQEARRVKVGSATTAARYRSPARLPPALCTSHHRVLLAQSSLYYECLVQLYLVITPSSPFLMPPNTNPRWPKLRGASLPRPSASRQVRHEPVGDFTPHTLLPRIPFRKVQISDSGAIEVSSRPLIATTITPAATSRNPTAAYTPFVTTHDGLKLVLHRHGSLSRRCP